MTSSVNLSAAEYRAAVAAPKASKFRNKPLRVDGAYFASGKEANRFVQLQMLERKGKISNLKRQVAYDLAVNGVHITRYVSDHEYDQDGAHVVEDSKGFLTPEFKIKARLMKAILGIDVVLS